MELVQAFCQKALFAEKDSQCLRKQLDLDSKAVDVGRYVILLTSVCVRFLLAESKDCEVAWGTRVGPLELTDVKGVGGS